MLPPPSELVNEPRVYGAKCDLATLGPIAQAVYVVEEPFDLGARKVGVYHEPGLVPDHIFVPLLAKFLAYRGAATVLPNDGVVDRLSGVAIPHHGGLALVGDADGGEVVRGDPRFLECLLDDPHGDLPDLVRVVFDPSRPRVVLGELRICASHERRVVVENEDRRSRSPLVYR